MRKLILVLVGLLVLSCVVIIFMVIPLQAAQIYGPPSSRLSVSQRVQYSARLLWYDGLLTRPLDARGSEQSFTIESGESVDAIANRLEVMGFIRDAESLRMYLIYTGLDTSIQAGEYKLSASMSAIDIAHEMQDATSSEVTFVILPGWRMEEIAALFASSGLPIEPDDFFSVVKDPHGGFDFLPAGSSAEGFLYPDSYIFSRQISANDVVREFIRHFALHLARDMQLGFENQGLTVYQAVTLASIVQREAVHMQEAPQIAAVFLNRLNIGMKLEADPTVQYAIGYNAIQNTWWTNPLSAEDLEFISPFNTYVSEGLPPTPIANPGLDALNAVAFPAQTTYYFFRAACDGSGYHVFAETFEEHVQNGCE